MNYLLDTNVLSEFKKPSPDEHVVAWARAVDEDRTFISVVTLGELRRGIALMSASRRKAEFDECLRDDIPSRFERRILDITPSIADAWGELTARAKQQGLGPHAIDFYIAATAQVHAMTVVTRNVKDFVAFDMTNSEPWLGHDPRRQLQPLTLQHGYARSPP